MHISLLTKTGRVQPSSAIAPDPPDTRGARGRQGVNSRIRPSLQSASAAGRQHYFPLCDPVTETHSRRGGASSATHDLESQFSGTGDAIGGNPAPIIRVCLIGASAVGKTSLVRQFIENHPAPSSISQNQCGITAETDRFPNRSDPASNGIAPKIVTDQEESVSSSTPLLRPHKHITTCSKVSYYRAIIKSNVGLSYQMQINDLPPTTRWPLDTEDEWNHFRGYGIRSADAIVLVFDMQDESSFESALEVLRSIRTEFVGQQKKYMKMLGADSCVLDAKCPIIAVVGNKCDLTSKNAPKDQTSSSLQTRGSSSVAAHHKTTSNTIQSHHRPSSNNHQLHIDFSAKVGAVWRYPMYMECSAEYAWRCEPVFLELIRALDDKFRNQQLQGGRREVYASRAHQYSGRIMHYCFRRSSEDTNVDSYFGDDSLNAGTGGSAFRRIATCTCLRRNNRLADSDNQYLTHGNRTCCVIS